MGEYAGIYLKKKQSAENDRILSVSDAVHSSYRDKDVFRNS